MSESSPPPGTQPQERFLPGFQQPKRRFGCIRCHDRSAANTTIRGGSCVCCRKIRCTSLNDESSAKSRGAFRFPLFARTGKAGSIMRLERSAWLSFHLLHQLDSFCSLRVSLRE